MNRKLFLKGGKQSPLQGNDILTQRQDMEVNDVR
jgi:hypothetical protein